MAELINGIDVTDLEHQLEPKFTIAKLVPGRVCHIDADFLAYQVSYDDNKALSDMQHNCDLLTEKMRLMSGSESVVLHLTPKGSSKGGRYEAALIKEYQGNRKGKPKPKFLHVIREWMHKERGALLHMEVEADDGMSIAQYKAIAEGNRNLSIIATKDKDLYMVPGLSLDWDTGEISDTETDFGYIYLDTKGKQKKIRGRGWKYFWAQMLTGDPADNISGVPKICTDMYLPNGKPKACGPVMAFDILDGIKDNKKAFRTVRDIYKDYGQKEGFYNYRDGTKVPFGIAFQSEAQLLWMRRKLDITDAIDWMREHCI